MYICIHKPGQSTFRSPIIPRTLGQTGPTSKSRLCHCPSTQQRIQCSPRWDSMQRVDHRRSWRPTDQHCRLNLLTYLRHGCQQVTGRICSFSARVFGCQWTRWVRTIDRQVRRTVTGHLADSQMPPKSKTKHAKSPMASASCPVREMSSNPRNTGPPLNKTVERSLQWTCKQCMERMPLVPTVMHIRYTECNANDRL